MTREEALLKLLAVEPETRSGLILVTGWPADETDAVLNRLVKEKKVGYGNGPKSTDGQRLYRVKAEAL